MASIREQVRTALFGKLNVSGVTTNATGGIYNQIAPETASTPFVVFSLQAPGEVQRALGGGLQLQDDLWMVKAITSEADSSSYSPQELADLILTAAETAIGTTLTLSSNTVRWCARFADIPPLVENVNDRLVWQHGFLLRVASS